MADMPGMTSGNHTQFVMMDEDWVDENGFMSHAVGIFNRYDPGLYALAGIAQHKRTLVQPGQGRIHPQPTFTIYRDGVYQQMWVNLCDSGSLQLVRATAEIRADSIKVWAGWTTNVPTTQDDSCLLLESWMPYLENGKRVWIRHEKLALRKNHTSNVSAYLVRALNAVRVGGDKASRLCPYESVREIWNSEIEAIYRDIWNRTDKAYKDYILQPEDRYDTKIARNLIATLVTPLELEELYAKIMNGYHSLKNNALSQEASNALIRSIMVDLKNFTHLATENAMLQLQYMDYAKK